MARKMRKSNPSAIEEAAANITKSRLWSVKARQKIRASAFKLRHELFRQFEPQFRIATEFSERSKQSEEIEGGAVFHNRGLGRVAKLFCFGVSILNLSETVDQLIVQGVLAGQNSAVGDGIAQGFGRQPALASNDPKKLIVSLHHKTLNQVAFFRSHWPGSVQNILELTALEHDRGQPDFVEQLFVVQGLYDNTDAAGDGGFTSHQ